MAASAGFALPSSLEIDRLNEIVVLRLARPEKRNALDDTTVRGIETFFAAVPAELRGPHPLFPCRAGAAGEVLQKRPGAVLCRGGHGSAHLGRARGSRLPDDRRPHPDPRLGATETGPFAMVCTREVSRPGVVGLPVPGNELKLVAVGDKREARVKGPNVTPGYWREPELTRKAFDEEGYYRMGDAVRFVDPTDVRKGFLFDGRLSEDFKLSTGTWVSVGPLRARFIGHFAPFVKDAVIAGHDRDDVAALVFPDLDACRTQAPDLRAADPAAVVAHAAVRERFATLLNEFAAAATGSSNRIVRAILLDEPPSLDKGESTDKGTINQRAGLDHRAALVEEIFAAEPSARVTAAL